MATTQATGTPVPTPLSSPILIQPQDDAEFKGKDARPVFSWSLVEKLEDDEYYVLIIVFPHEDGDWYDFEQTWTKKTSWGGQPDQHLEWFLYDDPILGDSRERLWYVVVKQKLGTDEDGGPIGIEVGKPSAKRSFVWERTNGGHD